MQPALSTDIAPADLDYRMLSTRDLMNIALQRSDVLADARRPGELIREWIKGDEARFEAEVAEKGAVLAQRAMNIIQREFEAMLPVLDEVAPSKIADIGCGYGFFGLLAHARYGCDLLMIDIEHNEKRHFGFETEGSGYSDLKVARRFLTANGVPETAIITWNPEEEELEDGVKPDMAVSFLACGFHFPVDMYIPFFRYGIVPGGSVVLDVRRSNFQENRRTLAKMGKVSVLAEIGNRRRILLKKGRK